MREELKRQLIESYYEEYTPDDAERMVSEAFIKEDLEAGTLEVHHWNGVIDYFKLKTVLSYQHTTTLTDTTLSDEFLDFSKL